MPQWEVPDQQPQRCKDRPEDEAVVDISCCIEHAGPGIWSFKSLNKWLVLSARLSIRASTPGSYYILLFDEGVVDKFGVPTTTSVKYPASATESSPVLFVYFGSHCTYPLLVPFTSLTTNSKPSKSSAVTASNATSNRIRAHSKKE